MFKKEELEALTVDELKAKCKELSLEGYSKLTKDELVSLNAIRYCKTETKGEVLGKFEISKKDLAKDEKIKRFIEIGFIVEL